MKRILIFSAVVFLAACNNSNDSAVAPPSAGEPAESSEEIAPPPVSSTFPDLFAYLSDEDSSFSRAAFTESDVDVDGGFRLEKLDTASLRPYLPYLIYSPSRHRAIDAASNNYVLRNRGGVDELVEGGPDTEVALLDLTKNERRRLYFSGAGSAFLEARWDGDSSVLIAVAETKGDSVIPEVRRYHVDRNTYTSFQYPTGLRADIRGYAEKRFNATAPKQP